MKAHYAPFSARIRRYKHLAKQVNQMLKDGRFLLLSAAGQKKLLQKLRQRLKTIGHLFPQNRLRETLAGIALLLGTALANPLDAQTFAPAVASPFGIAPGSTYGYPVFADIDGDGDLDMLVSGFDPATFYSAFVYYENVGTPETPLFVADNYEVNPFGLQTSSYVLTAVLADFDNDGDLDLMVGTLYGGIIYYENTGTADAPAFANPQANPFGLTPGAVFDFVTAADIDNDGDLDLLSGGLYGSVTFFENTGSPEAPSFSLPVNNPFGISSPGLITVPHLTDLDGDGDVDLLFMGYIPYGGSTIYYAQNTGTPEEPAFAPPVASPFNITAEGLEVAIPTSADIDNDGDMDVFINDYSGNVIFFYENTTISVQVPPTASNSMITTDEDVPYFFTAANFNFMDANPGDQLSAVEIVTVPIIGQLRLSGVLVAPLQVIPASEIQDLSFEPFPDDNGIPYASFLFRVSDGIDWSLSDYEMTINVNPVNDAPTSQDVSIGLMANETHSFSATDFPFEDIDGDDLQAVRIASLPDKGSLQLGGVDVTASQVVTMAQLGGLTFTPGLDESGMPYTSFDFEVSDGQEFAADVSTLTINVEPPSAGRETLLDVQAFLTPNPASDFIQLKVEAAQAFENLNIVIFDETGRTVHAANLGNQSQVFQQALDVTDFAPGAYWLKIESGGKWKTLKFVKL